MTIDLNCDLGEFPDRLDLDDRLAEQVTSLNIACGGHAGDDRTMAHLVETALRLGRCIGAHPGYPDRENFGRHELPMNAQQIEQTVLVQVRALSRITADRGATVRYVKPHGALYHAAMHREEVAFAIASAVAQIDPRMVLVGQAGAPAIVWWRAAGRRAAEEAFADRRYEPSGELRKRTLPGALLESATDAAAQALDLCNGFVIAADGTRLTLRAETICLHSDTPGALAAAQAVRSALERAGINPQPLQ